MKTSRRAFLKATAAAIAAPAIVGAQDKALTKPAVVGNGNFRYACHHGWGQLPPGLKWQTTHGVAVDSAGLIYITHRGTNRDAGDTIVIFDAKGKHVRSFGREYHGGGHGIDIRKEGTDEFLYLSNTRKQSVVKTTLKGEVVWTKALPKETGKYDGDQPKYSPTNVNFMPDGGFVIGDGYGSHFLHRYDKDAKWMHSWGGFGDAPGKMKTPHGHWLDERPGREPAIVVCDRANARLQYFGLDGKHLGFVAGLSFPADIDIRGEVMLVPDLHARISLFDKNNQLIDHLGHDPEWTRQALANNFAMRSNPDKWQAGRFVHPHDACFDHDGNIFVAEWVSTGRITKLERLG